MKLSWIKSSTKWYLKSSKNNISVQFVSCHSYQENLLIDIRWVLTRKKSTLFNITVQDVQITTNQRRIWTTTFKLLMLRNVQNAHNLFNLKENSITIMSKLILCLVLNVQNDFLQKICWKLILKLTILQNVPNVLWNSERWDNLITISKLLILIWVLIWVSQSFSSKFYP